MPDAFVPDTATSGAPTPDVSSGPEVIIRTKDRVTLVGGGPAPAKRLIAALSRASVGVAADGGADALLRAGHMPKAVIGDLDSVSASARARISAHHTHHIAEQDSTDFAKCLSRIAAPLILAVGFTGGQLDHGLAACTTLGQFPAQRCILLGKKDICFLAPLRFALDLPRMCRFSLYPLGPVRGTSTGLQYPIDGIEMRPDGRVGTSNAVTGPVRLSFDRRKMLVILPAKHLDAVIAALEATPPEQF